VKWDDSYEIVPIYQAELLKSMPGSVVEYETPKKIKGMCASGDFL
jgi:hypothetical protein